MSRWDFVFRPSHFLVAVDVGFPASNAVEWGLNLFD